MTAPPDCIFCGGPGGSREHAWPEWLRKYALSLVVGLSASERVRLDAEANFTVDCVCHSCNTGWMRKLESKTKPILEPIIAGEPSVLTARQTFLLRRWAIKTAFTFECHLVGGAYASESLRRALRLGGSPRGVAVLLGYYEGRHLLSHTRQGYLDPLNEYNHLSWVTMVVGKVLLHVFSDFSLRHRQVTLTRQAAQNFVQLPAGDGVKIEWPSGAPVDDELLSLLEKGPNREMRPPSIP